MQARKCDRCGKLYETPKQPRKYKIALCSPTKSHYRRDLDICSDCHEELVQWFDKPKFINEKARTSP